MTVDEPIQENEVRELLHDVLLKENLQNAKIEFQRGSKVGDGFLGVTNAIEVKGDNKELKLFVKAAPKDKTLRETLSARIVFLKEICFYWDILPVFDSFLEKRTGKPLNLTAKCYAINSVENKEMLLFDNLKDQGFELFNKKQLLDQEHVLLVLRTYAKFHGVSYILKRGLPNVFQDLSNKATDDIVDLFRRFDFANILKGCVETLKEYNQGRIDGEALNRLEIFVDGCYEFLESSVNFQHDHKVILHGDCWVNNMLFKYEVDNKIPTDMRLLDFQISRINLPVFDLSYFFYCSAPSVENLTRLDFYLEYYHKQLSSFTQNFNCDVNKIYPYEIFKDHWKQFGRYGLLLSLYLTKMVLSEGEETPNMAKRVEAGSNHEAVFDIKLSNNDKYVERIRNILLHFVDNKFI